MKRKANISISFSASCKLLRPRAIHLYCLHSCSVKKKHTVHLVLLLWANLHPFCQLLVPLNGCKDPVLHCFAAPTQFRNLFLAHSSLIQNSALCMWQNTMIWSSAFALPFPFYSKQHNELFSNTSPARKFVQDHAVSTLSTWISSFLKSSLLFLQTSWR